MKKTLLLCKEHGDIPEDICTLCHPEVQKAHNIEMCPKGHGLPKHFCTECGTAPSASLDLPDDGWCATHNTPEALCLECQKDPGSHDRGGAEGKLAAGACRVPLPTVRLASARLAERVGIETATAVEEEHAHTLVANAETAYDANRYADISPRVDGFLREVRVDLGRSVLPGEVLAVVDSSTVSAAKAQYVSAHDGLELVQATFDRIRSLRGAVAGKQEIEARTALNQAKANAMDAEQKLRNFGFDDAQLARILKERDTRGQLNVVAPIGGTVVLRHAVRGEAVQATTQLFSVADTSKMWLWIDVYEVDVAKVALGQRVAFVASGAETEPHEGRDHLARQRGQRADPDHARPGRGRERGRPPPRQPVRPRGDPARRRAQGRRRPEGGHPAEGQDRPRLPPRGRGALPPPAGPGQADESGRRRRGRVGAQAGPAGGDDRVVPAQDRDHEGRHRRRLLRIGRLVGDEYVGGGAGFETRPTIVARHRIDGVGRV